MRKSNISHRERKLRQNKRRRKKHGEGVWIPSNMPSRSYLEKVLKIKKK